MYYYKSKLIIMIIIISYNSIFRFVTYIKRKYTYNMNTRQVKGHTTKFIMKS
jgi:hypothetical protein